MTGGHLDAERENSGSDRTPFEPDSGRARTGPINAVMVDIRVTAGDATVREFHPKAKHGLAAAVATGRLSHGPGELVPAVSEAG